MALEYFYKAILTTKCEEAAISAVITDTEGNATADGCTFKLYDKDGDNILYEADGAFDGEEWTFILPAEITDLDGRHYYSICRYNKSLSGKEPIFFL